MKRTLWAALGVAAALTYGAIRRRRLDLRGRVVVITGGSRGLGLLLARELGRRGCRPALLARDEEELEKARRDLDSRGIPALVFRCDVTREEEVTRAVRQIEGSLGPVDVLVNNAGIIQVGPLETMELHDFERSISVNFGGMLRATLAVLPGMIDRGEGRIVNITSIGGEVSVPHLVPYCCAKFAAVGFSEGLRAELASKGISVTTVVPGLMRTGSPAHALFQGRREAEFTWFGLSSSSRLTSMDAGRAARRIARALERGKGFLTLSWQARLLRFGHALAPELTGTMLGLANRLLPSPPAKEGKAAVRGMKLSTPLVPSRLTGAMNRAARRNNEYGGSHQPALEHARAAGVRTEES